MWQKRSEKLKLTVVYRGHLTLYMFCYWSVTITEKGPWNIYCESKGTVLSTTTTAVIPFKTSEIKKNKKDTDVFPQQPLPAQWNQYYHLNETQTSLFRKKKKKQKKNIMNIKNVREE